MDRVKLLKYLSILLLVLGVLGFVMNPVLGIFATNTGHNLLYLVVAILGFVASQKKLWLLWFARLMLLVFGALALLGFLNGAPPSAPPALFLGKIAINFYDNLLHLVFAAIFGYIAFAPSKKD